MLDNLKYCKVLLVNGVNTQFGGSVSGAIKAWQKSFAKEKIDIDILNTVPNFNIRNKNILYKLLLILYFFPGTLFRIFNNPICEFLYKISPLLIFNFLRSERGVKPKNIIFSHHAIFFLGIFVEKLRRIFLIQDLIYIRAKSMGFSRRIQRLCFAIELCIYRHANILFVLSYHENRILRYFLSTEIYLIKSWQLNQNLENIKYDFSKIAVISDWRRNENIHGALKYFMKESTCLSLGNNLYFNFYGFNSDKISLQIQSLKLPPNVLIKDGGAFKNLSDIQEGVFLVPIYQGAGIKLKTIEALSSRRFVLGTKAAFIGLPSWIISDVTKITYSLNDFPIKIKKPEPNSFIEVTDSLSLKFIEIAKVPIFYN